VRRAVKYISGLALLANILFSFAANAGGNYFGVWSGTVTQMAMAGQKYEKYNVSVTVTPRKYRIDYDSLACGGELRLIKQQGRFFRFRDELDYGLQNCDNGGRTEIHFLNPERATFQWFDKNGVMRVEGRLKKLQQLMI